MKTIWENALKEQHKIDYEPLHEDTIIDTCIIGGGITGITTAYLLQQEKIEYILLEKNTLMSQATSHTTGKITYAHGLFYRYLLSSYRKEIASLYLQANMAAIEGIKQIVEKENIDCDFCMQDEYIYTQNPDTVTQIKDEFSALQTLGASVEMVHQLPIPLPIQAGIRYQNQAMFHPTKYLLGLLNQLPKEALHEHTGVTHIQKKGDGYLVTTEQGNKVRCRHLVLATKYPIKDMPGFYFTKLYQETSYAIAIQTDTPDLKGMYNNCDVPSLSLRNATYKGKDIVLVVGNHHKTGENISLKEEYHSLETTAATLFQNPSVITKWNTEDAISLDKIPYIGEFSHFYPRFYVATGFKKWGMTTSFIAATMIKDGIMGKKNPWEAVFHATRFGPIKNRKELGNMLKQTTYSLLLNRFKIPQDSPDLLPKGQGKIMKQEGKTMGIYKDNTGKLYAVEPFCTHLGCLLTFNDLDHTWDCPCHGSRFTHTGENLYSPAYASLPTYNLTPKKTEE